MQVVRFSVHVCCQCAEHILLSAVCMLSDTVCMLSAYGVQVVRFSVHVCCQCAEHMLLSVVCMLHDTVCMLSAYGVQVVMFSVHVVNVQNTCSSPYCARREVRCVSSELTAAV